MKNLNGIPIREILKSMKQKELAQKLGVAQSCVSQWLANNAQVFIQINNGKYSGFHVRPIKAHLLKRDSDLSA